MNNVDHIMIFGKNTVELMKQKAEIESIFQDHTHSRELKYLLARNIADAKQIKAAGDCFFPYLFLMDIPNGRQELWQQAHFLLRVFYPTQIIVIKKEEHKLEEGQYYLKGHRGETAYMVTVVGKDKLRKSLLAKADNLLVWQEEMERLIEKIMEEWEDEQKGID